MAAELYYTPSTYTSSTTGTFSFWIKRGKLNNEGSTVVWSNTYTNDNNRTYISFEANNKIRVSVQYSGNADDNLTNAQFADTLCWYHVVIRLDSTQGTAANRCLIWVNGQQQSMSSNAGSPSGNITAFQTSLSNQHYWGGIYNSTSGLDNAYLTQCVYCDGQTYSASNFGETDATTGEWKPKTDLSGLTFGNNGYWLKFENSANIGLDSSGNSNNFTNNNNEVLQVSDNPSNVFATLNPLVNNAGEMMLLTNGNTSCQSNAAQGNSWKLAVSTLGMTSGKYYWEIKFDNVHNCYNNGVMGSNILTANTSNPMNQTGYTGFYNYDGGEIRKDNVVTTQDYGTYATNDIMGVACDMDNHTITFYKNGSAFVSNVALSTTGRDVVFPCSVFYNTNNTGIPQASYNFGNGYFGTTAVASAGSNASGNGIFEYDVPSGYTALSTKGLNL